MNQDKIGKEGESIHSLTEIMQYILFSGCTCTEWVNIGTSLRLEGFCLETWGKV